MDTNQRIGRITGVLLLVIFITGITIFQVLQGPVLFSDQFLSTTAEHTNQIIISVLLGTFSGILSIVIAALVLPIFKRHSPVLAYLYLAFCVINFVTIMVDNVSVVSMLELSKAYTSLENDALLTMGQLAYEQHWWTHYFYLLVSCFPVFVLYYTLYSAKLIPRLISVFGMAAVVLMFTQELLSFFGNSLGMFMMLPMALVQLALPLWLIIKGFKTTDS